LNLVDRGGLLTKTFSVSCDCHSVNPRHYVFRRNTQSWSRDGDESVSEGHSSAELVTWYATGTGCRPVSRWSRSPATEHRSANYVITVR